MRIKKNKMCKIRMKKRERDTFLWFGLFFRQRRSKVFFCFYSLFDFSCDLGKLIGIDVLEIPFVFCDDCSTTILVICFWLNKLKQNTYTHTTTKKKRKERRRKKEKEKERRRKRKERRKITYKLKQT